MLKFLRKYQKWMLAVFCVVLMVAFLVPQAQQQFAPEPSKRTMATTYDGEKITREMLLRVSSDLQLMRRLSLDPINWPGLTLLPNSGSELDDALVWMLVQRAAERNNIGASKQEAFNLIASVFEVQDEAGLKAKAGEVGTNAAYLLELGRQYLVAEQYRQLVAGTEFVKPTGTNSQIASPGLQRYAAAVETRPLVNQLLSNSQQLQMFAQMMGVTPQMLIQMELQQQGALDRIIGYERVTADQLRYILQRQMTELDLTVVLLDAEDRRATVSVSQEDIDKLFERYADDAPGTGQPYGLGYRVPDRVKLEAMRIPIDAVREAVAREITPDDIFKFYEENKSDFINTSEEGEAPKPQTLTAVQREQIRLTLTQVRAEQKAVEIARQARLRLNEDARGLEDDGPYKKLPKDFKPTPLVEVAAEIEQEHGVAPQIIQVDDWVSREDIARSARFTGSWINRLPGSTVKLPDPQFGFLMDQPVSEAILGGRAGLFASFAPELSNPGANQIASLADYIQLARPFVELENDENSLGLQVGLPGRILADVTRSTYVFRISDASPSAPRTDPAPIADKLREDTAKVAAYEELAEEKDELIERAAAQSIEQLMSDAKDKKTLTAVTRQTRPNSIATEDGEVLVRSNAAILVEAFGVADAIIASGGMDKASIKDRIFAVELPGDYKLALVRLDTIRPLTRSAFKQQAANPGMLGLASRLATAGSEAPAPLSIEALMQATGFEWAEGYGPETLSGGEEEDEEENAEGEDAKEEDSE